MASYKRQKESLRAALLAYLAGAHCIIEEVEKARELSPRETAGPEARHADLRADFERVIASGAEGVGLLCDMLGEEELYPFGSEWPHEALAELLPKVVPPKFSFDLASSSDGDEEKAHAFRFKKGFKELLSSLAEGLESGGTHPSTFDHWLALLLNTAFYAGATIAARMARTPKQYYAAIEELETEAEPWGRYPQLVSLYEKQLSRETRRKTGLVTDLDYEN